MSELPASVIVCTRNRSKLLAEACEAILAMDFPEEDWELVIIDNDSTDDTPDIARDLVERYPRRAWTYTETTLGLSSARNTGVRKARGEILAFIDDDAFPEKSWLRDIVDALNETDVLCAGGPVDPLFQGDLPDWLDERYLPYLTVWDLGPDPVELRYNEYPRGANMAFRREVFERFGGFSHKLGRTGKSLLSCEETELCLRAERAGGRIMYVPGARVDHMVNAARIDPKWMIARFGAQGRSEAILDWMHAGREGLRCGKKRYRRIAEEAARQAESDDSFSAELFARCQKAAEKEYRRGALLSPFKIPRYRPGAEAGETRHWLPFE